tara:strand:- start:13711 stop:14595 length:885 start_codon:yes stop_codon:yes gene_type:complete
MAKTFENREGWIWYDGEFVQWNNAKTHIISQGLHYASAVFEGERSYNGKIFKSDQHTKRFFKSAETIGIIIPFSESEINKAKEDLIFKMNYKDCYVRPFAWRGSNLMGLSTTNSDVHVSIAVWDDWTTYYKLEDMKEGLSLITSPWKRPPPDSIPFEAKASGPYLICTLSKSFAESKGYNEALMLDYRGYVAEATSSNIFLIKDKEIHTPIPDCFLNGITRQTVIEMVEDQGFNLVERYVKPDELKNYDEVFLTGTAAEITPVKSIDSINFNTGDDTKTFQFMKDYRKIVTGTN